MDILELDACLSSDGRRALENLALDAVRAALDFYNACVEMERTTTPHDPQTFLISVEDRKHFLEILGALAGIYGTGDDGEYLIQWSVVDRVRAERRRRAGAAQTESCRQELLALPAPERSPVDFSRRRGRPPIHPWPQFCAEMTRRCMAGPLANQAVLEDHMAQWCSDNWITAPALSQIRDWVAPTFAAIQKAKSAADNSPRDLSATTS